MQISCNPADLNKDQREAVAAFILTYPAACAGTCGNVKQMPLPGVEVAYHVPAPAPALVMPETTGPADAPQSMTVKVEAVDAAQLAAAVQTELEKLAQEVDEPATAAQAFTVTNPGAAEAAAVFAPLGQPGATTTPVSTPVTAAPSAPAPTVPTPPTPGPAYSAAPVAPAGVELDKHGLPWDTRIHVDSKAKNADGSWRNRRQLDPAVKAQVEQELRTLMAAPAPQPAAAVVPAVPAPAVTVPPAPVPATPVPAAPVDADPMQKYVALVGRVAAAVQAGKITPEKLNEVCSHHGVAMLPLVASRLDLVDVIARDLDIIINMAG